MRESKHSTTALMHAWAAVRSSDEQVSSICTSLGTAMDAANEYFDLNGLLSGSSNGAASTVAVCVQKSKKSIIFHIRSTSPHHLTSASKHASLLICSLILFRKFATSFVLADEFRHTSRYLKASNISSMSLPVRASNLS